MIDRELAWQMRKTGTGPNDNDYDRMPDWRNIDPAKRRRNSAKGAEGHRSAKVKVTVPPVPWEDPEV